MYRMTGGSAGVAQRLDDPENCTQNVGHASEDELALALVDRLVQEGYCRDHVINMPQLRILRDPSGKSVAVRASASDLPACAPYITWLPGSRCLLQSWNRRRTQAVEGLSVVADTISSGSPCLLL